MREENMVPSCHKKRDMLWLFPSSYYLRKMKLDFIFPLCWNSAVAGGWVIWDWARLPAHKRTIKQMSVSRSQTKLMHQWKTSLLKHEEAKHHCHSYSVYSHRLSFNIFILWWFWLLLVRERSWHNLADIPIHGVEWHCRGHNSPGLNSLPHPEAAIPTACRSASEWFVVWKVMQGNQKI